MHFSMTMIALTATSLFVTSNASGFRTRRLGDDATSTLAEVGFDYVGNDVANGPGKTIDDCLPLCKARTDCKAFSWSDHNGGTCWLKSARKGIKIDRNVQSSGLWTQEQIDALPDLRQDTDFVNNDLTQVLAGAATDCLQKCRDTLGCRAFSFNDHNGGTCWLKSKRDQIVHKAGVTSGLAYPIENDTSSNHVIETDVDYPGHDLDNVKGANADECFQKCQEYPGCHVFSWSKFMGGTCWLKSWKEKGVYNAGVNSGVVSTSPATCNWAEKEGTDYVDNDFAQKYGIPDRLDCCQICKDQPGCQAFTWSEYKGGTCWLKTKIGDNTKIKAGVFSGSLSS